MHPSKRSSGQRSYQKKDIEAILAIKRLLYEDLYTIAGAKKKLREEKTQGHVEKEAVVAPGVIQVKMKDESSMQLLEEIRTRLQDLQEEIESA